MNEQLNQLLQECFVTDLKTKVQYANLTESQKLTLTKNIMDSVVKTVINKSETLDYDMIKRSNGSISKIQGYADLVGAINGLEALQQSSNHRVAGVDTVRTALQNLQNLEPQFKRAFTSGSTILEMVYNNMVVALISSTAYLISSSVDLIKADTGLINMVPSVQSPRNLEINMLKSLEDFNKMCLSGDMNKFLNRALPELHLSGNDLMKQIATLKAGLTVATKVTFITVSVFLLLRSVVYQYYNMRVQMADYLRMNASFIEMNQTKLMAVQNMQQVARKQGSIAKTMVALADKIDIDQKVSSKKANMDISKDTPDSYDTGAADDLLF